MEFWFAMLVVLGHHLAPNVAMPLCYMARYSLGPPLRCGLPPYGRHHSTALMQNKYLPK